MARPAGARTEGAPLAEQFRIEDIVTGLAADLRDLRAGTITVEQARVRAELAKQLMNGVRLVVTAQKFLADNARLIGKDEG